MFRRTGPPAGIVTASPEYISPDWTADRGTAVLRNHETPERAALAIL